MKRLKGYWTILAIFVLTITGVSSSTLICNERNLSPDFKNKQVPIQYVQPIEYPDDVGGAYYDNKTNELCYLVVNPTPDRIKELRVQYGENIEFTPCKYSYNELMKVFNEIYLQSDSNIRTAGVDLCMNRVVVGVYENHLAYYRAKFEEQYGDKVYFEKVTGVPTLL